MNKLPLNYKPYSKLIICDNELNNCNVFIDHNGFYPILIGKGPIPLVWINNKYTKFYPNTLPIVTQNISSDKRVKIFNDVVAKTLTIRLSNYRGIQEDIIINIIYDEKKAIVNIIDLRPLGYNIYGDCKGMYVGGNLYRGNKFSNIDSMFKIGD